MQAGRLTEAQEAIHACLAVLPDMTVADLDRVPLKDEDRMEEFRECLRRAGLPDA